MLGEHMGEECFHLTGDVTLFFIFVRDLSIENGRAKDKSTNRENEMASLMPVMAFCIFARIIQVI